MCALQCRDCLKRPQYAMVTKTEALKRGFGEAELAGLQFFSKTSARNFKMKLYLESQLADLVAAQRAGELIQFTLT